VIHRRFSHPAWVSQSVVRASLVIALTIVCGLIVPAVAAAAAEPVVVENQAGSRDTLALVNLGDRTSAIHTFVSADGGLTREQSWKSGKGAFDYSRARFAAGDVNGDGLTDGIVLYNLGRSRARFYVFLSDGTKLTKRTAWTSARGAFAWSRAKLAVGDINGDGRDDVVVLYDRGRGRAELQRFVSKGRTFSRSVGWRCGRGGLYSSRAQLAVGDANGDGGADAVILYRGSPSRLLVFEAKGAKFVKKTFWSGAYPAGAKLATGDVDSDGDYDAVCLRDNGDGRAALDAFLSDKSAFAAPVAWWLSAPGELAVGSSRLACGDLDADGKADAVLLTAPESGGSLVAIFDSTGAAFEPGVWWAGATKTSATRLACGPSLPFILRDDTEVLGGSAGAALESVSPDGAAYTFTSGVPQVDGLVAGDIMVLEPGPLLPYGALRKVVTVTPGGGHTVVTTTQGTIEEAVAQGELAIGETVTQDDIETVLRSAPGVRLVSRRESAPRVPGALRHDAPCFGKTVDFDLTLDDIVKLSGSLGFNESFSLTSDFGVTSWKWGYIPTSWGMKNIRFAATTTQTTTIGAALEGTLDKEIKKELASYQFATIVVWFGPVPVTFTPELSVYIGADGEVTAGVSSEVSTVTTMTTGLEWKRGSGWSPIKSFGNTRTYKPPELFGTMSLRAFAGLELMLKIYQLAGPTASLEAYTGLFADTSKTPWWKLSAGLDAKLGFKVDVVGVTLAEFETSFNLFEYILAQAGGAHQPQGAVSGKILVAGTTTPVDGATVELHQGAANPSGTLVNTTTSGSDGAYAFAGVTPGSYTVVASKIDFAANNRTVTVTDGATTTGQDVELTPQGTPGIGGTVSETGTGTPLSGVLVELRQGDGDPLGDLVDSTSTPAGGAYQFLNLLPGVYTVVASKSGYFTEYITVTVGSSYVSGQDIELAPLTSQGVSGRVFDWADGSNVAGATVTLHEGYDNPDGPVWGTTTSAPDGTYSFDGVPAEYYYDGHVFDWGYYTAVATKAGYVRGIEEAEVYKGDKTTGVDLGLAITDSGSPAKADGVNDHLNWPGVGLMNDNATYEVWFKPTSLEPGYMAQISFWYGNFPGPSWGKAPTMFLTLTAENVVAFGINQYDGSGPGGGTWHEIDGTTQLQVGQWYHIAAQNGSAGMKLFINGHREAYDSYTGRPEADWSDATLAGGWFSLGDNDTWWPAYVTARGQYKWVRVSKVQRYYMDFTPPAFVLPDGSTDIIDSLLGNTNGWNYGYVWAP